MMIPDAWEKVRLKTLKLYPFWGPSVNVMFTVELAVGRRVLIGMDLNWIARDIRIFRRPDHS
jgi:hypothetical protein